MWTTRPDLQVTTRKTRVVSASRHASLTCSTVSRGYERRSPGRRRCGSVGIFFFTGSVNHRLWTVGLEQRDDLTGGALARAVADRALVDTVVDLIVPARATASVGVLGGVNRLEHRPAGRETQHEDEQEHKHPDHDEYDCHAASQPRPGGPGLEPQKRRMDRSASAYVPVPSIRELPPKSAKVGPCGVLRELTKRMKPFASVPM